MGLEGQFMLLREDPLSERVCAGNKTGGQKRYLPGKNDKLVHTKLKFCGIARLEFLLCTHRKNPENVSLDSLLKGLLLKERFCS